MKTIEVSAISFHKLLGAAWKQEALSASASVVALSYIGAQRFVDGYGDMADAKAMLESIARNFGALWAHKNKSRVNIVSQSPVPTPATGVVKGFGDLMDKAACLSPLGNAGKDDLAAFICMLFSDYARMVTMQTLYHDGGFSAVAIPSADAQAENLMNNC